ncbi:MAG: type 4a pilus biogenesis protein PilO [Gallionella sp.]
MRSPRPLMDAWVKGFNAATKAATSPGRIRWMIRTGLLELGLLGVVGIGIFAMCAALYLSALRPGMERLQILRDNFAQKIKPGIKLGSVVDAKVAPEEQLAVFYGSFPLRDSVPESLEKIYSAAADEGLNLDRADYKTNRTSTGKMTQYQITLPIRGHYSKIHKFLVQVLRDVPSASLERVLFERKKIGDPSVDATVTMVLYLGPEP